MNNVPAQTHSRQFLIRGCDKAEWAEEKDLSSVPT
jgi:hypothetical protein